MRSQAELGNERGKLRLGTSAEMRRSVGTGGHGSSLIDRLLDRLDEERVPRLLVRRQLGGVFLRILLARIVVLFDELVRIAEHAPDDLHPGHLGRAGPGLGRFGSFRLGRGLLLFRLLLLLVFVAGLLVGLGFGVFLLLLVLVALLFLLRLVHLVF